MGSKIRHAENDPELVALSVEADTTGTAPFYLNVSRPEGSFVYSAEQEYWPVDRRTQVRLN
ncbi:hypothetical protein N9139_01900 [Akkermansiaceae bacterium]|nr:hypothetical protein [Akkermansiaceae bacterium]